MDSKMMNNQPITQSLEEIEEKKKKKKEEKTYRSPFFLALLQSLSLVARSPKLTSPLLIRSSYPLSNSNASSFVRRISGSFQLLGRRLSLCLTSKWAARILPSLVAEDEAAEADRRGLDGLGAELWWRAMWVFILAASVPGGGSQRDSLVEGLK